jgi:hypothetical protein
MKRLLSLIAVLLVAAASASAQNLGASLLKKADEAFNARRWKSAGTLYDLYLRDSVGYTPLMAQALLADELDGDSVSLTRADAIYERNGDRLALLLPDLKRLCVTNGFFDTYEESVSRLRASRPELRDSLLCEMIDYRLFLRDGEAALRLAQLGRLEEPDNVDWLRREASARMMLGETTRVLALYRSIRAVLPNDLEALIYEGNYHYLRGREGYAQLTALYPTPKQRSSKEFEAKLHDLMLAELNPAADLLNRAFAQSDNKYLARSLYDIYVMRGDHAQAEKLKHRL